MPNVLWLARSAWESVFPPLYIIILEWESCMNSYNVHCWKVVFKSIWNMHCISRPCKYIIVTFMLAFHVLQIWWRWGTFTSSIHFANSDISVYALLSASSFISHWCASFPMIWIYKKEDWKQKCHNYTLSGYPETRYQEWKLLWQFKAKDIEGMGRDYKQANFLHGLWVTVYYKCTCTHHTCKTARLTQQVAG